MATSYDAIIVGARCAGAPTAMLLARHGHRILLVDRATFPSDTVSTHIIQPHGMALLARWGLADRVVATGCPPIHRYTFDFGPFTIVGRPGVGTQDVSYCPRRTVLDKLLVNAAVDAGAEMREGFTVDELVFEGDQVVGIRGRGRNGASVTERAEVVIGADGAHSVVAAAVGAHAYHDKPALLCGYYTYFSGLPMNGRFETFVRPERGIAAAPTNDDKTLVIVGWPVAEFEANKKDIEGNFYATLDLAPAFAARVRAARREERFAGYPVPNYLKKPFGLGWALVGDAGYNRDPITAQGITDAFHDAELCATAIDESLRGDRPYAAAMTDYHRARDARVMPMYEMTCELAKLEPPPPETQQIIAAVRDNPAAMDAFVRVNAGTMSAADFFAPEHLGPIMAAAAAH